MVRLPLVRGTRAVPEEEPLQSFVAFKLVRKAEDVLLVGELEKVEKLGACLHHWEWRILGIVDDDRDTAWQ